MDGPVRTWGMRTRKIIRAGLKTSSLSKNSGVGVTRLPNAWFPLRAVDAVEANTCSSALVQDFDGVAVEDVA